MMNMDTTLSSNRIGNGSTNRGANSNRKAEHNRTFQGPFGHNPILVSQRGHNMSSGLGALLDNDDYTNREK